MPGARHAPAALRNRGPIAEVLKTYFGSFDREEEVQALEIASGDGTHVSYLARKLPANVTWQPSEFERRQFDNIAECVKEEAELAGGEAVGRVRDPVFVDISDSDTWNSGIFRPASFHVMYNANMIHISPYKCTLGLFEAAGALLKPGGRLFTYGPYALNGSLTPESNVQFDETLRAQNSDWGIRDIADLTALAAKNGLKMEAKHEMPANNKILVWKKLS